MMKANELMIGDWVKWLRVPCKVDLALMNTEFGDTKESKNIEPIPLTKEILEKNGFVWQDCDHYKYFDADNNSYYTGFSSIHYRLDRNYAHVTREFKSGPWHEASGIYKYVHELQHAIRLCGVKKEIII